MPIIDSVAASLDFMKGHVERVVSYNAERTLEGRFLLGHDLVDSCLGAVFVVDDSTAMPVGGASFMLDQIATTLDYWCVPLYI